MMHYKIFQKATSLLGFMLFFIICSLEVVQGGVHNRKQCWQALHPKQFCIESKDTSKNNFVEMGRGLPHIASKIKNKEAINIAFLGGSITHMKGWRDLVMDYFIKQFPENDFHFLDAGIPSLGSLPHAFRLQEDLLDKMNPDLVFIEAAVNDEGNGTPQVEQLRALEGIVRHIRKVNNNTDMVLMAFADEVKLDSFLNHKPSIAVEAHEKVAKYYKLPFLNLAREVFVRIQNGEFSWKDDFKNLHPAPFGQSLYFNSIKNLITQALDPSNEPIKTNGDAGFPKNYTVRPLDPYNYSNGKYLKVSEALSLKGFEYVEDWQPSDCAHVRPGFVHVPILEAETPGASLRLGFSGTAIGIAVNSGPDAGAIYYRIDDGRWAYKDLYTRWSQNLHLPWYELLGDELPEGNHVLEIKNTRRLDSGTKGTAVRIVHFLEN